MPGVPIDIEVDDWSRFDCNGHHYRDLRTGASKRRFCVSEAIF